MKRERIQPTWFTRCASTGCLFSVFLLFPVAQLKRCEPSTCESGCLIADTCYENGVSNPQNACEVCNVVVTRSNWTIEPAGTACGYCLQCSIHGSCTELGDNCCSTDGTGGVCVEAPVIRVKEGCLVSHDYWGVWNELNSGIYLDLICKPDGEFDVYDIRHTTIQHCPGCPNEMHEQWYVNNCDIEFKTEVNTCAERL